MSNDRIDFISVERGIKMGTDTDGTSAVVRELPSAVSYGFMSCLWH